MSQYLSKTQKKIFLSKISIDKTISNCIKDFFCLKIKKKEFYRMTLHKLNNDQSTVQQIFKIKIKFNVISEEKWKTNPYIFLNNSNGSLHCPLI